MALCKFLHFIFIFSNILHSHSVSLKVYSVPRSYQSAYALCDGDLPIVTNESINMILSKYASNKTVWLNGSMKPLDMIMNYDDLTTSSHDINMFPVMMNDFTNDSSFTIAFDTWKRLYDYDWSIIEYEAKVNLISTLNKYKYADNPSTSQLLLLYNIQQHLDMNISKIVLNTTDNLWYIVHDNTNHTVVCMKKDGKDALLVQYSSSMINLINTKLLAFMLSVLLSIII